MTRDLVIVGGGMAGLTAAWHAARHGLSSVLMEKEIMFGGQIATLGPMEGLPGLAAVTGVELSSNLAMIAQDLGVDVVQSAAISLRLRTGALEVACEDQAISARAVLVASGAHLRTLGVPGETALEGRGVSHCAECDGPLYRGEDVIVVGGGDAAFYEALALSLYCDGVRVLARGKVRAAKSYRDRVAARSNITVSEGVVVEAILGDESVRAVAIREPARDSPSELPCRGVFVFAGTIPNTEFLGPKLERTTSGHLRVDADFCTSLPGVYAIGAVRAGFSGQLVSAWGEAAAAVAHMAQVLG